MGLMNTSMWMLSTSSVAKLFSRRSPAETDLQLAVSQRRLWKELVALIGIDCNGIHRADTGGPFRVIRRIVRDFSAEQAFLGFVSSTQIGLTIVSILLKRLPFGDALKRPNTGLAIEFDVHML